MSSAERIWKRRAEAGAEDVAPEAVAEGGDTGVDGDDEGGEEAGAAP